MSDLGPPGPSAEDDPWLREALRHAPDAAAAPPRAVSAAILREAHSAAAAPAAGGARRAAAAPSFWQGVLAFWSKLGTGPGAAAMAGLLVAVFVGLLWWEQPLDEAMPKAPPPSNPSAPPRSPPSVEATPAATTAALPAPTSAPTTVDAPAVAPALAPAPTPVPGRVPANASANANDGTSAAAEAGKQRSPDAALSSAPAPEASSRSHGSLQDERREASLGEAAASRSGALQRREARAVAPPSAAPPPVAGSFAKEAEASKADVERRPGQEKDKESERAEPRAPRPFASERAATRRDAPRGFAEEVERKQAGAGSAPTPDSRAAPPPRGRVEPAATTAPVDALAKKVEADAAQAAKSVAAPRDNDAATRESGAATRAKSEVAPTREGERADAQRLRQNAPAPVAAAAPPPPPAPAPAPAPRAATPVPQRAAASVLSSSVGRPAAKAFPGEGPPADTITADLQARSLSGATAAAGPPIGGWLERPLGLRPRAPGDASASAEERALSAWLSRLDSAARGRWTSATAVDRAAANARAEDGRPALGLTLFAEQRRLATVRFAAATVWIEVDGPPPNRFRVGLPADAAAALRASWPAAR